VYTPHAVAATGRHCLAEPQQVLDAAMPQLLDSVNMEGGAEAA